MIRWRFSHVRLVGDEWVPQVQRIDGRHQTTGLLLCHARGAGVAFEFVFGTTVYARGTSWRQRRIRYGDTVMTRFDITEDGTLGAPRGDTSFERVVEAQDAFEALKRGLVDDR